MILSNVGIQKALREGRLEISPEPIEDQYTTSAVDLFLGDIFQGWDEDRFQVVGARVVLNLAEQKFQATARGFLKNLQVERDGTFTIPPYRVSPSPVLAVTRERIHLKPASKLAARVEGRSSLARLGLMVHLTAPSTKSRQREPRRNNGLSGRRSVCPSPPKCGAHRQQPRPAALLVPAQVFQQQCRQGLGPRLLYSSLAAVLL